MAGKPVGRPRKADLVDLLEKSDEVLGLESDNINYAQNNTVLPPVTSEAGPGYGDESIMTLAAARSVVHNDMIDTSTKRSYQDLLKSAMGRHHTQSATTYVDNRKITISAEVRDVPNTLESEEQGLIMARKILKALLGMDLFNECRLCARGHGFKTQVGTKTATWLSQMVAVELESKDTLQLSQDIEPFSPEVDESDDSVVTKALASVFGVTSQSKISQHAHLYQCSAKDVLNVLVKRILLKDAKQRHAMPHDVDNDEEENNPANV